MTLEIIVDKSSILFKDYRGRLTEGVTYNSSNDSLLWVDIPTAEVSRYFFKTGKRETLKLKEKDDSIAALCLTNNDDVVLVCNKYGVYKADFISGTFEPIVKYPENLRVRSNDAIIDPNGNLIVGTINELPFRKFDPEGNLYKIDSKTLDIETLKSGPGCSNGMGFNSSLTKFYWIDSGDQTVYVFDYDKATGSFTNQRPFFHTKEQPKEIFPDGMCVTVNDTIYVAGYLTSYLYKLNELGEILAKYKLPAKKVTCCTVGGKNNDELFITTASLQCDDFDVDVPLDESGDCGGYLFRVKLDHDDKPGKEIKYTWGGYI